jgi:hypothetical protein
MIFCKLGVVPVYMGPSIDCKPLLPRADAAIFVDDFPSTAELATYLLKLTTDESAYERHREWRKHYLEHGTYLDGRKAPELLTKNWPCR